MSLSPRRRSWILATAVIAACGWLAADAARSLIDARFAIEPEPVWASIGTRARPRSPTVLDKDGAALVARNIFCSDCGVAPPDDPPGDPPGDAIPITGLPLQLVATNLASPRQWSFATIRDTSSLGHQGSYWVGDRVPGGGPIERIAGTEVIFASRDGGRRERLLLGPRPASRGSGPVAARPSPYADQIVEIDPTRFEIDRALVRKLLANPPGDPGARVRPVEVDGEARGFRVSAVKPRSLVAALGVRNGDVIESINGMVLSSPDRLLEIYGRLRDADNLTVTVRRADRPTTLRYRIR